MTTTMIRVELVLKAGAQRIPLTFRSREDRDAFVDAALRSPDVLGVQRDPVVEEIGAHRLLQGDRVANAGGGFRARRRAALDSLLEVGLGLSADEREVLEFVRKQFGEIS